MIRFPILKSLSVVGYQLFPGAAGKGLHHRFGPGVDIIVGINGLGKTTLLNIIYRLLLGPTDGKGFDGLGSNPHRLVPWRDSHYFRLRVGDEAANATASATIAFGPKELTVSRSLRDLSICSLSLGSSEQTPSEERYKELIIDLANLGTYFDFYALLRYVVFFLEDRTALIWDPQTQFDIFRILFYDREKANLAATLFDDIQRTNSDYRNKLYPHNKRETQLKSLRQAHEQAADTAARLGDLQVAFQAAEEQGDDLAHATVQAVEGRQIARLRLEQAKLELEEKRREYEGEQQKYFSRMFPSIETVAEYVLVNLAAGGICLVCGNTDRSAPAKVHAAIQNGRCPVCDSLPERQEKIVPAGQISVRRLEKLVSSLETLKDNVIGQQGAVDEADREFSALVRKRQEHQLELSRLRIEIDRRSAELPPTPAELQAIEEVVRRGRAELDQLHADQVGFEESYSRSLEDHRLILNRAARAIKARFAQYAGELLAERCELVYSSESRSIGQSGEQFEFPRFQVLMTSGTFLKPSERRGSNDVSESQKEFIDLAFRMAVMAVAARPGANAMLVLETPEASLDSLFVSRVGKLLRGFAEGGGKRGNLLIASSNLNNENMIPSLLGFDGGAKSSGPRKTFVRNRLVNLLEEAAPNAALRDNRQYYTKQLRKAHGGKVTKKKGRISSTKQRERST